MWHAYTHQYVYVCVYIYTHAARRPREIELDLRKPLTVLPKGHTYAEIDEEIGAQLKRAQLKLLQRAPLTQSISQQFTCIQVITA